MLAYSCGVVFVMLFAWLIKLKPRYVALLSVNSAIGGFITFISLQFLVFPPVSSFLAGAFGFWGGIIGLILPIVG